MKKQIFYIFSLLSIFAVFVSCNDFGNVNNDPEHYTPNKMDYRLMFTQIEQQSCGSDWDVWRNGLIYGACMLQHTSSLDWVQGVFYTWSDDYNGAYWMGLYSGSERGAIRNAVDIMNHWKDNRAYSNSYQMCRIMKAYMLQRMTDLYGDVPYTQAGRGYSDNIYFPTYDRQEFIYMDLLNELNDAQSKLDPALDDKGASADLIYQGNAAKWKEFANSLMLRVAMRLSKVKPYVAAKWVKIAVSNGLFENLGDAAIIQHNDGMSSDDSAEPYGKVLSFSDPQAFFLSDFFVDMLKNTNDPRLPLMATTCKNPKLPWGDPAYDLGNNDPALQKGMPVGYDLSGGKWDLSNWSGYKNIPDVDPADPSKGKNWRSYFAMPNRTTFGRPNAPTLIVTYAENQLLLAEAALRGWISGDPNTYYANGVKAAMEQFSFYPAADASYKKYLTQDAINQYLTNHPLDPTKAYEQINTQYYIATFCNEYETFANWRRSGYPVLTPVNSNYPNAVTNGTIPRRFTYPTNESQVNQAHYNEAVSHLSDGDKMTSRVWWDLK